MGEAKSQMYRKEEQDGERCHEDKPCLKNKRHIGDFVENMCALHVADEADECNHSVDLQHDILCMCRMGDNDVRIKANLDLLMSIEGTVGRQSRDEYGIHVGERISRNIDTK